jgi:hypothetical protein
MILTVCLVWAAPERAQAQEADTAKLAFLLDGTLGGKLPPLVAPATHELCGIGLGGRCPRGYRACRRTQPEAVCQDWLARCEACAHAMAACRQQVGHTPGFSCTKCRAAFDACEARLRMPAK